ncbi:hypothetical protein C0J52_01921 [Blattella germanica]|nr:hypothetical protein C0J52_01921 [Blattella germanica]
MLMQVLQGKLGADFHCKCILQDPEEHRHGHFRHHPCHPHPHGHGHGHGHGPEGEGVSEGPGDHPHHHHHHHPNGTEHDGPKGILIPVVVCLPYGEYDEFAKTTPQVPEDSSTVAP